MYHFSRSPCCCCTGTGMPAHYRQQLYSQDKESLVALRSVCIGTCSITARVAESKQRALCLVHTCAYTTCGTAAAVHSLKARLLVNQNNTRTENETISQTATGSSSSSSRRRTASSRWSKQNKRRNSSCLKLLQQQQKAPVFYLHTNNKPQTRVPGILQLPPEAAAAAGASLCLACMCVAYTPLL